MKVAAWTTAIKTMVFTFIVNMRSKGRDGVDHESITWLRLSLLTCFLPASKIYNCKSKFNVLHIIKYSENM
jgi:hypothetical protein